jgi:O-antigen ligase
MNRFSFCFWFFYAARAAFGVLLHMGAHQFVYFDSVVTFLFAAWLLGWFLLSGTLPKTENSTQPVLRWILLYLAWSFVTLLWTPAPLLLAGGKLLKIALEAGIVLATVSEGNIHEITSYSIRGFLCGAVLAASLYGFYPRDEQGRAGVAGGLDGYEIALMTALAGVIAFIEWAAKPDRWRTIRAVVLAGGTMILMYKSSIVAYGAAIAPFAFKSGSRTLVKTAIAVGLLAWLVFPWVAPYLIPYIEGEGYLTLTGRLFIWADALTFIIARPILGSGYDSPKVLLSDIGDFSPGHAHNDWLQNWMSLGLIGTVLMFAVFLSFFRVAWQHRTLPAGQIALGVILFGLVRGITDTTPDLSPPIGLMLLLTAKMNAVAFGSMIDNASFKVWQQSTNESPA